MSISQVFTHLFASFTSSTAPRTHFTVTKHRVFGPAEKPCVCRVTVSVGHNAYPFMFLKHTNTDRDHFLTISTNLRLPNPSGSGTNKLFSIFCLAERSTLLLNYLVPRHPYYFQYQWLWVKQVIGKKNVTRCAYHFMCIY